MHGYLSSKESFSFQIPFFSKSFDVYAFDLKGFGENRGMEYPYSLSDYENEVREYMYKKGIVKPHVIAHSFGGRIALKAAAKGDGLFDKLVLTGCAGLKPERSFKYKIKSRTFKILSRFMPKNALKRFYSADYLALDSVMKESFVKIVNEQLDGVLSDIKNRTLIVFGENDKETPLYMAEKLHRGIKGSELIIIKNAAHFCFIDKPLKFNGEVKEFLLRR